MFKSKRLNNWPAAIDPQQAFGKDRKWLNHNRTANYVIGGWQLNGIGTVLSGTPQQVFMAANTLFNNGGTQRANWNGRSPKLHTPITKRLNQSFDTITRSLDHRTRRWGTIRPG